MAEFRLVHDAWVVVADGEKALFLRNEGDATYPNLQVVRTIHEENPPSREQGTDKPGRFNDGHGVHRSAVDETDWHRIEKERFAADVAERRVSRSSRRHRTDTRPLSPPSPRPRRGHR